jgi:uncharacterized membrane protein (DUF485 family)
MKKAYLVLVMSFFLVLSVAYGGVDDANGSVGCYPLDNNLDDESGNNYDLTAYGAVLSSTQAKIGNGSLYLDGTDDFANSGTSFFTMTDDTTTFCAWLYRTDTGTGNLVKQTRGSSFDTDLTFITTNYQPSVYDGSTQLYTTDAAGGINAWHHYCITYDGSTFESYIDGSSVGTDTGSVSLTTSDEISIGQSGTNYLQGYVDQVMIFNEAKTSTGISAIYNLTTDPCAIPPAPSHSVNVTDISINNTAPHTDDDFKWDITINDTTDAQINYTIFKNDVSFLNGTITSFSGSVGTTSAVTSASTSTNDTFLVQVQVVNGTLGSTDTFSDKENSTATTIVNRAPTVTSASITPTVAYNSTDLEGTCTISDADAHLMNVSFTWYRNDTNTSSGTLQSKTSGTHSVTGIANTSTQVGDEWVLGCVVSDGFNTSTQTNSTTRVILPDVEVPILTAQNIVNSTLLSGFTAFIDGNRYQAAQTNVFMDWLYDQSNKSIDLANNNVTQLNSSYADFITGDAYFNATNMSHLQEFTLFIKFVLPDDITSMASTDYTLLDRDGEFTLRLDADGTNKLQLILWDAAGTPNVRGSKTDWQGGQWYSVAATTNATHMCLYVDGALDGSCGTYTAPLDVSSNIFKIGISNAGLGKPWNGTMDEVRVWNRTLTMSEIQDETNNQTVHDADELLAHYGFNNYLGNNDITASHPEYLTNVSTGLNASTSVVMQLTQSKATFQVFEKFTNDILVGTISGQPSNSTFNLNTGAQNVTFSKAGYYSLTQEVSPIAASSQTLNISGVYDQITALTAYDSLTNASISNFNATLTCDGCFQVYAYEGSGTELNLTYLQSLNYTLTLSAAGYNDKTITDWNENASANVSMDAQGRVLLYFYDGDDGHYITQTNITVVLENGASQYNYNFNQSASPAYIDIFEQGEPYTLYFNATGYSSNEYTFTYSNQGNLTFYMVQNATSKIYTVYDTSRNTLQNVQVQIEKYVNGTYQVLTSTLTDATGKAYILAQEGVTHRVTFSKTAYVTLTDVTRFYDDSYEIVLQPSSQADYDRGYGGITIDLNPDAPTLNATTQTFNFTITTLELNLTNYSLRLLDENMTLISATNGSNPYGSTLTIFSDMTSYNNTRVFLEYEYALSNGVQITDRRAFYISDAYYYEGTFLELKDRLANLLTTGQKIALFAIVFFVALISVSIFVTGFPAVLAATAFSVFIGWIFGINIFLLSFILLAVVIFGIAYSDSGGGI